MKLNGKVKCSKQITRVYAQFDLQSYIFQNYVEEIFYKCGKMVHICKKAKRKWVKQNVLQVRLVNRCIFPQ